MRTLKLTLAYDGTSYVGWQRQTNGLSVQQVIEEVFVPLTGDDREPPTVVGAGRTDAGVHALGQVASVHVEFSFAASAVQRAMNDRLPADIRVLGVIDAKPGFHARHHAIAKSYRYRMITTPVRSPFDRLYAWHAPGQYDVDRMQEAARVFVGRHDFASFQARGASIVDTVRTVQRFEVRSGSGEITFEVDGDGFLRHMVRAMIGTVVEAGQGQRTIESIASVIDARDRRAAGPTVPALGLTLLAVRY